DLSGFLRVRQWYAGSKSKMPDTFPPDSSYNDVHYQDLFFRGRLYLKVLPNVEIRTVFDISSSFGKDDFAIGNGGTNIITRDVYAVFTLSTDAELSVGLQPFSLPGGYIIARDATGGYLSHYFFNRKVKLYGAYINAFDDADDSFGEGSDDPEQTSDNIFIAGMNFNITSYFSGEAYYVHEHDNYTTEEGNEDDDIRKSSLHWGGLHLKLAMGDWFLSAGGIYNGGHIYLRDISNINSDFQRTDISAWLGECEAGYRFSSTQVSIVAEGATGDPNSADANNSFQDIKASHEFSNIIVDNYGGLALRGSGESSWYGMYGAGIRLQSTFFSSVTMNLRILHFRTTKSLEWNGSSSTWLGDEADIRLEYLYQETVSVFMTAGAFLPGDAYRALDSVQHDSDDPIIEAMIGVQINF
nr:alginate export family protein [Spirochaetota bacterium]